MSAALISVSWSSADSLLMPSVIDGRPHFFHDLPLPFLSLHRCQIILLGDRSTRVRRTCL